MASVTANAAAPNNGEGWKAKIITFVPQEKKSKGL
jgi:hypothetical protein